MVGNGEIGFALAAVRAGNARFSRGWEVEGMTGRMTTMSQWSSSSSFGGSLACASRGICKLQPWILLSDLAFGRQLAARNHLTLGRVKTSPTARCSMAWGVFAFQLLTLPCRLETGVLGLLMHLTFHQNASQ